MSSEICRLFLCVSSAAFLFDISVAFHHVHRIYLRERLCSWEVAAVMFQLYYIIGCTYIFKFCTMLIVAFEPEVGLQPLKVLYVLPGQHMLIEMTVESLREHCRHA